MKSKKWIALMVAPIFALGLVACGTDQAEDEWQVEEGQLPAYEVEEPGFGDPALEAPEDTVVLPEEEADTLEVTDTVPETH
jgi:hypothetical protein